MSSRPSRGAARLAAILDALPDALVLVNANGTVVNANTIALAAFETPGTALVGRGLLDLLPQFDSRLIPGTMRRPDSMDPHGQTKPTRMIARRTDGTEFPVEVTSANLENGQQAYDSYGYTNDELLMLVVRDLSGTVDTEAELARSQRQTEMILRAAAEGVVGTDTEGRVVLVNPAAAQILGYRASDLGGRELHTLVLHSRADGEPFPYGESPLADTLRSGRKHRVRGQVLWSKSGDKVSVDLTTAPVRDGDQLVGAVMTFTDRRPYDSLAEEKDAADKLHEEELERVTEEHASELTALRQQHVTEIEQSRQQHVAEIEQLREEHEEELAAGEDRYAALAEREKDRYEALAGRQEQLLVLLGRSLRGPLDELRRELATLAADDAGQLWPEANQVLHHLSAGYSRITTLVDNVLAYQRLDTGVDSVTRTKVMLDAVVAAGVDGAVELIGPGRVQFAVHAPPIEAEVDPQRLATALAHLVADVAGVDATGNSPASAGGYLDNTVVVAAAQRGEVVRIEVRGPYTGGDPVHEPIVRGIVRAHGGVLQTHEVPGMSGSAYVLEVPIGGGAGAVVAEDARTGVGAELALPEQEPAGGDSNGDGGSGGVSGRRRARRASVDAFLEADLPEGAAEADAEPGDTPASGDEVVAPTGRRRRRAAEEAAAVAAAPAPQPNSPAPAQVQVEPQVQPSGDGDGGTGRRRGRPSPVDAGDANGGGVSTGAVVMAGEHGAGTAAVGSGLGGTVPPQGVPGAPARRGGGEQHALPPALPAAPSGATGAEGAADEGADGQPTGRRRRALAAAAERGVAQEAGPRPVFALPPAEADRTDEAAPVVSGGPVGPVGDRFDDGGRHDGLTHDPDNDHTPPQPHPTSAPTGRRRARQAPEQPGAVPPGGIPGQAAPVQAAPVQAAAAPQGGVPAQAQAMPGQAVPAAQAAQVAQAMPGQAVPAQGLPPQPALGQPVAQPVPGQPLPGQSVPAQGVQGQQVPQQVAQQVPQAVPQAVPQVAAQQVPAQGTAAQPALAQGLAPGQAIPAQAAPAAQPQQPQSWPTSDDDTPDAGTAVQAAGAPLPPERAVQPRLGQALPAEAAAPVDPNSTQGRAISVRTLGQGVAFSRQAAQVQTPGQPQTATPPHGTNGSNGSGRRRKLGTRPEPAGQPESAARPHPQSGQAAPATPPAAQAAPAAPAPAQPSLAGQAPLPGQPSLAGQVPLPAQPSLAGQTQLAPGTPRLPGFTEGAGRSYAIGAPDENAAEGPEPLDGPGGAVEVSDQPQPRPMDDELPPEPLDNPRRLLVWPAPDVTTQQALSDRGYRPVIVHSREEVNAQIAAFPAALFVDPLTGPITRTALQSLRQAAVAAEVPVLVTAGLGQATREAAYGADPAVLLKALAPRDSEQHPPRVLLIEEHAEIALALTATLERRGMQVARAASDADAVTLASQLRPNLVVMDLLQVKRRRAGIVDWLRANGQLNRTPLVVYTAAVDQADLPRLASGETVLFLAERSTSTEVQDRIVDLLARIGTN
ncbi:PAS domain-containing protein [Streptomyces turgidiscabies]|uniref:PAS domain-containing hybrid sensor histidine kinase/response regulator n=1 Tax=Streptomyces TaxID=1883 RepID=UPI00076EB733|nr:MULTISPECIES: PAS domain-containing protein [Streptomyces]MDX3499573.1 PAS domain-containing protein [Streptomyces turgidiscabies]GAQ69682.1 sensory histidine kinase AtoS [Streptomyces turgidiscabies]